MTNEEWTDPKHFMDNADIPDNVVVKAQKEIYTREEMGALARLSRAEALEEAAKVAKVAWLTSDTGTIGDADYGNALCEEIAGHIRALKDKPKEKINPNSKIF